MGVAEIIKPCGKILINFFLFFLLHGAIAQKNTKGHLETLYPWDNLEEDAPTGVIPNLEADAVDELANQDHEVEVLPITPNVIFWKALFLLKLQGKVSKGSKKVR